ncbi:MAG TPA: hypothetical protein VIY28_17045 [Pseudonocardiaceae bacterium]
MGLMPTASDGRVVDQNGVHDLRTHGQVDSLLEVGPRAARRPLLRSLVMAVGLTAQERATLKRAAFGVLTLLSVAYPGAYRRRRAAAGVAPCR